MKSKSLKKLFIMLAAVVTVSAAGYAIGGSKTTAYGVNLDDSYTESSVGTDEKIEDNINSEDSDVLDIKVSYSNESSANCFDPVITVTNITDSELNLKDLDINYYYVAQSMDKESFVCYYAGTTDGEYKNLTSNIQGNIETVEYPDYAPCPDTYTADNTNDIKVYPDKCAALTFNGGVLDAGQSMTIQCSIHKDNWSNYDVTDKSLCLTNAYINNELVYGKSVYDNDRFNEYNKHLQEVIMPELNKDTILFQEGFDWDNSGYNKVEVNLKGNTFEGIEGLVEGEDYTFEDNTISFKESSVGEFFRNHEEDEHDLYLKFSNNIKKTLTIKDLTYGIGIPEHFNASIGNGDIEAGKGSTIMIPIEISHNVGDILTQCSFDLKYDNEIFEDAYVVCDDENVISKADSEKGIINVTYDKHDDTLSGADMYDEVYGAQLKMNLALVVRNDSSVGNTKIEFSNKGFTARNQIPYAISVNRNTINISNN